MLSRLSVCLLLIASSCATKKRCLGKWNVPCKSSQTRFKKTLDAPFEPIANYDSISARKVILQSETLADCQKACLGKQKCVGVLFDQDNTCRVVFRTDTMQYKETKKPFYRLAALACEIKKYKFTSSDTSWLDVSGANNKNDCRTICSYLNSCVMWRWSEKNTNKAKCQYLQTAKSSGKYMNDGYADSAGDDFGGFRCTQAAGSQVGVETCTASAEQKNYPCDGAFDGKPTDAEGTAWASHDNTTNAVLQVTLKAVAPISLLMYKQRSASKHRFETLQLSFIDARGGVVSVQEVQLRSGADAHVYALRETVFATKVDIVATGASGARQPGAAEIEFWGPTPYNIPTGLGCDSQQCIPTRSCTDLGWTMSKDGNPTCFSDRTGSGSAFGAYEARATWQTANSYCAALGARLCSPQELAAISPNNTRDDQWSDQWSDESCSDGHRVGRGNSSCEADDTPHVYGSCCADVCKDDPDVGFFYPFKDDCQIAPCYNAKPGRYYTGSSRSGSTCASEKCPRPLVRGYIWSADPERKCHHIHCGVPSVGTYYDEYNSCHLAMCPDRKSPPLKPGEYWAQGHTLDPCPVTNCSTTDNPPKAGTKFAAGWNVGTCPVEQCGPAPVGQYYISVGRKSFRTCETRKCTNAPEGHVYVGGGGTRNQCPYKASSVTPARSGCSNPPPGHFFSSTADKKSCDTKMCPAMAGEFYFSFAQSESGCAAVRAPCTGARPGQGYALDKDAPLTACSARDCDPPAPDGFYYVVGGDCSEDNRAPCTPAIGQAFASNGRGTGKPDKCLRENCTIDPGFFFIREKKDTMDVKHSPKGCPHLDCPTIPGYRFAKPDSCAELKRCPDAEPGKYYQEKDDEPCHMVDCNDVNSPKRTWYYKKSYTFQGDQCLKRECSELSQAVPKCFGKMGDCSECVRVDGKEDADTVWTQTLLMVVVVAAVGVILVAVIVSIVCLLKSDGSKGGTEGEEEEEEPAHDDSKAAVIAHQAKRLIGEHDFLLHPGEVERGRKLAQGAGGQIFLGTFGRQSVALKESYDVLMNDEHDEIVREASMMTKLRHHNIVQFFGIWQPQDEERVFLVMELCSNGDLQNAAIDLDNTVKDRQKWILQVASAMKYLHTRCPPVVHRDLKPQNVLLDDYRDAKVCDFGLSKTTEKSRDMTVGVGTVAYMPPEVMGMFKEGGGEPEEQPSQVKLDGTKCDVFSFAILALYVATGVTPHDALSNMQICVKVSMSGQRTDIPPGYVDDGEDEDAQDTYEDFSELVKRMWAQNPDERPDFASIHQVLTTLFE